MNWPDVSQIVPEGTQGIAKIEHFTVSRREEQLRAILHPDEYIPPGRYVRLLINGEIAMSNTPMEQRTNQFVVWKAKGDVLIAGLGIGLILSPILAKTEVRHVTVIEKYQDVIDLVAPYYASPRLTVICADIFMWKPSEKFDTIYFDIWPAITVDNLEDIAVLHRRGAHWKKPGAWMDSWNAEHLRYLRRQLTTSGFAKGGR